MGKKIYSLIFMLIIILTNSLLADDFEELSKYKNESPYVIFDKLAKGHFLDFEQEADFYSTFKQSIENYKLDLNDRDETGRTILMKVICKKGSYGFTDRTILDLVKTIIMKKVELNIKDKYGNTALHYACYVQSPSLIKLLVENKADVNEVNNKGVKPFELAGAIKTNKEINELFKNAGYIEPEKDEKEKIIIKNNLLAKKRFKLSKFYEIVKNNYQIKNISFDGEVLIGETKRDNGCVYEITYFIKKGSTNFQNSKSENYDILEDFYKDILDGIEIILFVENNNVRIENSENIHYKILEKINEAIDNSTEDNVEDRKILEQIKKEGYRFQEKLLQVFFHEIAELKKYNNVELKKTQNSYNVQEKEKAQINYQWTDYFENFIKEKISCIIDENINISESGNFEVDAETGKLGYLNLTAKIKIENFIIKDSTTYSKNK